MTWTMYNDKGRISLTGYTEQEARQLLKQDESGAVYALNASGDFIETHDGPIHVGREKS